MKKPINSCDIEKRKEYKIHHSVSDEERKKIEKFMDRKKPSKLMHIFFSTFEISKLVTFLICSLIFLAICFYMTIGKFIYWGFKAFIYFANN